MALAYTYSDAYLGRLVTEEREQLAATYVGQLGTFPAYWTEVLVRARAYIQVCLDSSADSSDTFASKLAHYRKELADQLPLARAAAQAAETGEPPAGGGASLFTIDLERA